MDEEKIEQNKTLPIDVDELKPIEVIDKHEPETILNSINDDEQLTNYQKQLESPDKNERDIISPIREEGHYECVIVDEYKIEEPIKPIDKTERITFRVTKNIHRKIKILSIYNNMTMQDIMEQLLIEKLVLYEQERPGLFDLRD